MSSVRSIGATDPQYLIKRIDTPGVGNGQFQMLTDVIYVDTHYYVSDFGNDRVIEFDRNWNFVNQFGESGTGPGKLDGPYDLFFNGTYIYVTEQVNDRISLFKPDGSYMTTFGSSGTGAGQLFEPSCTVSDGEYIYVSNYGNYRVEVFNESSLAYVTEFNSTAIDSPYGISVSDNFLYVSETSTSSIVKLDKQTGEYRGDVVNYNSSQSGYLPSPRGNQLINDMIVVEDSQYNVVNIYDLNGIFSEQIAAGLDRPNNMIVIENQLIITEDSSRVSILRGVAEPKNVNALQGEFGIILTWDINQQEGATQVENYNVYRHNGTSDNILIGQTTSRSFTDVSVNINQTYTYSVESVSSISHSQRVIAQPVTYTAPFHPSKTVTTTVNAGVSSTKESSSPGILIIVPVLLLLTFTSKRRKNVG